MSYEKIDEFIWQVKLSLAKKHGMTRAEQDIAPLSWYIQTGRASCEYLRALLACKPFMVARRLHEGGSYDDALNRVKALF